MTTIISIQFEGATFNATTSITVQRGTFVLESDPSFSLSGTFPFQSLNLSSSSISFTNEQPGAADGTINIPLSAPAGGNPIIVVTNFSGAATISWPSIEGPQTQSFDPGDPQILGWFPG